MMKRQPERATTATKTPEATPVGEYANRLKQDLNRLDRALITGELADVSRSKVQVYFQLLNKNRGDS